MGGFLNGLMGVVGAGMDIYGQFRNQHQQNWQNDFLINNLNNARAQQERGLQSWNASADPVRDTGLQLQQLFQAALTGDQGSQAQLQQLLQQYPGVMDQLLGSGSDPFARGQNGQMQSLIGQNDAARGGIQAGGDLASQIFAGGGWTPGRQDTQDRFMDMLNGQGAQMATSGDVGMDLLGQRGQTALTSEFGNRAMEGVNRGGMNDQLQAAWAGAGSLLDPQGHTATLDALQSGGLDMFGNQGFNGQNSALYNRGLQGLSGGALGTAGLTQAGGQAELVGLQDLMNGGRTDLSEALGGRGMDLANREALLPMEQAFQIAREDAARNTEGAFKRAQRQALARKGGAAGVVAAGGAEGDAMSEWADQAGRAVSDAGRQALLGQQGLQLQQQGQGAGMAANAGGLENNRYGSAADLVKGMEGNATQRYQADAGIAGGALNNALGYAGLGAQTALGGQSQETERFLQALGLMPQISNAANNQLATYGQLGLGAGNLENSRMQTGGGLLQNYNQNRIAAGGLMNQSLGDQGQYALGAGNLQNNFAQNYQKSGNDLLDTLLRSGAFGAGLNQQQMQGFQQLFNNTQGFNRDNIAGIQGAQGNLTDLARLGQGYATAGLGQSPGMQPGNSQQNPFASIGQVLGNTDWSGMMKKGGGGGDYLPGEAHGG